MFKPVAVLADLASQQPHAEAQQDAARVANRVFRALQGAYGSLFLSKFSTGKLREDGTDAGIASARDVWAMQLQRFDATTVGAALDRVMTAHPEFPPSLPQFLALCAAAMPRQTYAEENNLPRLAAPAPAAPVELVDFKPRGDMKDWARRLLARHDAGEVLRPLQLRFARDALGVRP